MSELLDRFSAIKHLPLFPLPLVLLPNELLPLYIFEPRYRQMLKDLDADQKYFGITLFEPDKAGLDKPLTGTTGCIAEVRESNILPDGASNILTMGIIRYRLIDYVDTGDPYLVGDVEFFEDHQENEDELSELADNVHELFKRVAQAAFQLSGSRGRLPEIPRSNPQDLSFLIATAFNLDNELKYQMIETDSTSERLNRLNEILVHTVDKMEDSANIQKVAQTNGHGQKKIDL
ncbi:MAG: LON peptidase substrate-binding domain-containing protein [Pyrinomonadaceae bacterium]